MQAPSKLGLDLLELRLQPSTFGLANHRKPAFPRFSTDVGKSEKVEGFRFAQALPPSVRGRKPTELQQTRLLRVQFQAEFQESLLQLCQEIFSIRSVLKSHNDVIGEAHDDNIAVRRPLTPLLHPEIEHIMQIDVG